MDGATVDFALTRFEAVDGARLEVEGTWSGVRGVRFVRPALVVKAAGGGEKTLLADLEHKPWPANEGEPWVAAFPWPDGRQGADPPDAARTELAVAPSIVVPLARAAASDDGSVTVALDPVEALRAELAATSEHARRLEAEVAFLRREREDVEAARRERDEARAERGRVASEVGDVDALRAERDRLQAATRDAGRTAEKLRGERDALKDERDGALSGLEKLALERDALRQELDERDARAAGAARRREQALEERDAARRDGERAAESARAERDAARAEVETAAERAAARERERAEERLRQLREQLDVVEDERDRALAEPAGVAAPPVRVPRSHEAQSSHADWAARTAAILAVLVLLVLAITFLKAIA
jgi:hypothetical protein